LKPVAKPTVVVRDCPLLVPVTVTVQDPATEAVQESVEVCGVGGSVTLVGVRVQVKPVAGVMLDDRATAPEKPFRPVTVMVDVPATPI